MRTERSTPHPRVRPSPRSTGERVAKRGRSLKCSIEPRLRRRKRSEMCQNVPKYAGMYRRKNSRVRNEPTWNIPAHRRDARLTQVDAG